MLTSKSQTILNERFNFVLRQSKTIIIITIMNFDITHNKKISSEINSEIMKAEIYEMFHVVGK